MLHPDTFFSAGPSSSTRNFTLVDNPFLFNRAQDFVQDFVNVGEAGWIDGDSDRILDESFAEWLRGLLIPAQPDIRRQNEAE
jgi:hypothetical protein